LLFRAVDLMGQQIALSTLQSTSHSLQTINDQLG